MKRPVFFAVIAGLFIIGLTSVALAYGGYGYRGCRHDGCAYRSCVMQPARRAQNRLYDPATVETVRGDVAKVMSTKGRGRSTGVHLLVKSGHETIAVHVGPQWYLRDQDVTFRPGDKIEVTGSRITYDHEPVLIAAEVTQDGHVLTLRHTDGVPLWAGRGRSY